MIGASNDAGFITPTGDAQIFAGTATGLADRIEELAATGITGFRLRPGAIPDGVRAITAQLVPELQRRTPFRTRYDHTDLRGHLGLTRPVNRFADAQELINR